MILPHAVALACLLSSPSPDHAPECERTSLAQSNDPTLAELRAAGAFVPVEELSARERDAVAAAQAASADLLAVRGGELSNDTLLTVLLVLGIVAALIIIL